MFDERFFSYCEEADLALAGPPTRAGRSAWCVERWCSNMQPRDPRCGLVDYLQTRNTLLLVQEMSGWYHAFIRICFTLVQILRGLRVTAVPPAGVRCATRVLAGVRDFMLRRFGPPPPAVRSASRRRCVGVDLR